MAKASSTQKVAEWVGALVYAAPGTAALCAKTLRTAAPIADQKLPLWASPGSGIRTTHFELAQLINQLFATGCGSPFKAAETARLFTSMRMEEAAKTTSQITNGDHNRLISAFDVQTTYTKVSMSVAESVMSGENLGLAIEIMIGMLEAPGIPISVHEAITKAKLEVTIEPHPSAKLTIPFDGEDHPAWEMIYRPPQSKADFLETPTLAQPTSELTRVFHGTIFLALADIWRKTRANPTLVSDPNNANQNTEPKENAALPKAAPSLASPLAGTLDGTPHKQPRGVNNCDHTACVRVSSRGSSRMASALTNRRHSHDRAYHDAAA